MITSHGIAPRSKATAELGLAMLPTRDAPAVFPDPIGEQLDATIEDVLSNIQRRCGAVGASTDFYGLSDPMFRDVCGVRETPNNPSFIYQEARFQRMLLKGLIPPEAMQIVNFSVAAMLNKVSKADQLARAADGLDPALRPVLAAVQATKGPYGMVLKSDTGTAFLRQIDDIQKGLGVEAGCPRTVFKLRANYENGGAQGKLDCGNAFPRTCRQAMAESWHRRLPAAGRTFNAAYGQDSAVVFTYTDPDTGLLHVVIKACEEGSKQGDVFGSAGFCCVAQDVFDVACKAFPQFAHTAIIDDLFVDILPQDSDADWHRAYGEYAAFCRLYESEWKKRNGVVKKCSLLLPVDAPMPLAGVLPGYVAVTKVGHVALGAAIGTPAFIHGCAKAAVDKTEVLLGEFALLRSKGENKMSMKMAIKSVNVRLHYFVRVNPCSVFMDQIARHDDIIRKHCDDDLTLPGLSVATCSSARYERAHALLEQPPSVSAASMGRIPLAVVAPAAWCAGVLSAAGFPEFLPIAGGLSTFNEHIHALAIASVGGAEALANNKALAARLPDTPGGLIDPTFTSNLLLNYKKAGVQGAITKAAMRLRLKLLDSLHVPRPVGAVPDPDFTDDDVIAYHSMRRSSDASVVLNDIVTKPCLAMPGKFYVPYLRYMLLLPQLCRGWNPGAVVDANTGCPTSVCMRCDRLAPLDLHGNHAMACGARREHAVQRHDDIRDALCAFIREQLPESLCKNEPSAAYLMSTSYTSEECALLFPADSDVATKKMSAELRKLIDDRNACIPSQGNAQHAAVNIAMANLAAHIVGRRNRGAGRGSNRARLYGRGGVRPDILKRSMSSSPPSEDWIDISVGHDTTGMRSAQAMRALRVDIARGDGVIRDAPVIRDIERRKLAHYKPMQDAATSLFDKGDRITAPSVTPFALSSRGVMGPAAIAFMDKLKTEIIMDAPPGLPNDCIPSFKRAVKAKRRLTTEVLTFSAIGLGRILSAAVGYSWGRS